MEMRYKIAILIGSIQVLLNDKRNSHAYPLFHIGFFQYFKRFLDIEKI